MTRVLPPGIVQTEDVAAGRVRLAGTGVPTESLAERFAAGESIAELCADYDLTQAEVELALRYELGRR